MLLEGDTDKELFQKYVVATLSRMADLDRVCCYRTSSWKKLTHWVESIPADGFDGCLDDAETEI